MSDKKCAKEKKAEMEEVTTQVNGDKMLFFFERLCGKAVSDRVLKDSLTVNIIFRWITTLSRSSPTSL